MQDHEDFPRICIMLFRTQRACTMAIAYALEVEESEVYNAIGHYREFGNDSNA